MSVPVGDMQLVAPSAIVELFELQLFTNIHGVNTLYRFHAGTNAQTTNGSVVFGGATYLALPIMADGFEYNGTQLPRPKLRVSNVLGSITTILVSLPSGLEAARVSRIRTLARYIDHENFINGVNPYGPPDSTARWPAEIYVIDRVTAETRDVVEFELAASFDLVGVRAPRRQCIANICQWTYRSAECSYNGISYFTENDVATTLANDNCGKKLSSCKARFGANAQLPFGSFPAVGSFSL